LTQRTHTVNVEQGRAMLLEMLRLAWPMVLAQVAFLGMILTDTLVAGRFSSQTLAGVSLGSSAVMPGLNLLTGLCLAVAPAVSRFLGRRESGAVVGGWVSGALLTGVLAWVVLLVGLQLAAAPLAAWLATDAVVEQEMQAYLRWSTLGFPLMGVFLVLRNVFEAHSCSRPVMWWGFTAVLLNIPLDLALVGGFGPIPALGAAGVGMATSLMQAMLGIGIFLTLRRHPRTRAVSLRWGAGSRAASREFLRLGMPIGFAFLAESSLFALGGLLMAQYGTAAVGAHQICVTLAALVFMMQVAIGQATAVLLGRSMGEEDVVAMRTVARIGVGLGLGLALLISLVFVLLGPMIVGLFSEDPQVRELGAVFIVWAAIFHVADAMQAIHAAAMRGIHETREIMRMTLAAYLLVSIPMMAALTLLFDAPATGIWWSFTAGLLIAAGLLMGRFWWHLRRLEVRMGNPVVPDARA